jgi:hypothetical protein
MKSAFEFRMALATSLQTLAHHLAGEFDNRTQAIAEPAWFVHLKLWHCPVPLFAADSFTLFAEQANVLTIDRPYRQRLLRLQSSSEANSALQVQYYSFKDPGRFSGAGQQLERLQQVSLDEIELLPGCVLQVYSKTCSDGTIAFSATPPAAARCCFTYAGETRQVELGFESRSQEFFSYDKGVDPKTGKALWGAIMGPYQFAKRCQLDW